MFIVKLFTFIERKIILIMIPRRNIQTQQEPIELKFSELIQDVEKMGADIGLTDVVLLLSQAKDKVSDYIDKDK